jgi:predicted 3-demethylubiquinone-9 3-methyltransferase (glyoxalase superfamily)
MAGQCRHKRGGITLNNQQIVPHLWFDKEAVEAAEFYVSIFPDGRITSKTTLRNTPSGDCDEVCFEIAGFSFMAISAGPYFQFNPSISFLLNFQPSKDAYTREKLDELWGKLSEGGTVLMPLQEYPFSKRYGWIQDKYGVTWQLILSDPGDEERPFMIPAMMFVGDVWGKAEEARDFYVSVFANSRLGEIEHYSAGMEPDKEGTVMYADYQLANQWFVAMDSAEPHSFRFNEAISLLIRCENQDEIDYYWDKLSADPKAEQCGWLKDKYGVSWQVWPTVLGEMMETGTRAQQERLTKTFLQMKKFNIEELKNSFEGK